MGKNIIFLSILFLTCNVSADPMKEAQSFIKNKLDQIMVILKSEDLTTEKKKEKVKAVIEPAFDFELMAKLSLGKKAWTKLTNEKEKKFVLLFMDKLQRSYLEKFAMYTDEIIEMLPPIQKGNKAFIPTNLITKGNKIRMMYKLFTKKKAWYIYDVEIEGVSIIMSYRSQFSQFLKKNTMDDLLSQMDQTK